METLGTLKNNNADKKEKKEKTMTSHRWLNPIIHPFRVLNTVVALMKGQVRDRSFWRRPIYMVAKSQHHLDDK